jgi:hypothetical protein
MAQMSGLESAETVGDMSPALLDCRHPWHLESWGVETCCLEKKKNGTKIESSHGPDDRRVCAGKVRTGWRAYLQSTNSRDSPTLNGRSVRDS